MKRHTLKKTAAAVVIALSASVGSAISFSATTKTVPAVSASKKQPKESLDAQRKFLAERQQKITLEALEAVTGTQHALMALQNLETKKAMALLQDVSGKLDILLAKHPELGLIPADVEVEIYDFDSDSAQVQKLVDQAIQKLSK